MALENQQIAGLELRIVELEKKLKKREARSQSPIRWEAIAIVGMWLAVAIAAIFAPAVGMEMAGGAVIATFIVCIFF